jgi:hypothetical protein
MERRKLPDTCRKIKLRSLADLDGRTTAARNALNLRDAIADDLGGRANLSAAQHSIVTSAAMIGAMLEDQAAKYISGGKVEPAVFAMLANAQRRLLVDLGLERRARDVTPINLRDYVRKRPQ